MLRFSKFAVLVLIGVTAVVAQVIQISTFDELGKIGHDSTYLLNGHYELIANIDASASKAMNGRAGFLYIGDSTITLGGLTRGFSGIN
jgi:hypothetical protein